MQLGRHQFDLPLILAPMAGVTDRPFRQLCRRLGADLTVSEMVSADPALWHTEKSRLRRDHQGEPEPRIVQIAGGDAQMLADAAIRDVAHGADIIDINMGCPAKKVCKKWAGSALLANETLVADILHAVVNAVEVPVTLKIRTGPCPDTRNALRIARIAEQAGIAMLSVHGRTRQEKYLGEAEYETIAAVVQSVSMPVIANGDVTTPQEAQHVLKVTGAAGLMIGRGAQGNPWVFREIAHYLKTGQLWSRPSHDEVRSVMTEHVRGLHEFYGEYKGLRVARKHIGWYLHGRSGGPDWVRRLMVCESASEQLDCIAACFDDRALAA